MKKLIIAALFTCFIVIGCKKDKGQCYNCTYGTIGGYTKPSDEYCGNINDYRPKDPLGNDINYYCTPK